MLQDGSPDRPQSRGGALYGLANVLLANGAIADALALSEQAVALRPKDPVAQNTHGLCLANSGRPEDAAAAFQKAILIEARVGAIHRNLAQVLERLRRDSDAISSYERAFRLDPSDWQSRLSAAGLLLVHNRVSEALELVEFSLAQDPSLVPALLLLARLKSELREPEAAEANFLRAVALNPEARLSYGIWLMEEGRMPAAEEALSAFLKDHPDHVLANYHLSEAKGIKDPQDPTAVQLRRLAETPGLGADERVAAHFGIGRILDRAKQYEQAIRYLDGGNRLAYDLHFAGGANLKPIEADVDYAISHFNQAEITARSAQSNPSRRPIFIVGMIRSGTTLLEQIVSSHPDVAGAGELRFWLEKANLALKNPTSAPKFASEYLDLLSLVDPSSPRVTDKAPLNYRILGPLHATFPNAKILHIRRDPLDTCLSIYMMLHSKPPAFAHSQANIVFNYRLYQRVMEHWRKLLPPDALLEVDYQELVSNQEESTRRIIDFLGLDWNDACLHPERNETAVRTPSAMQVRQPVYRSSVERWRHYEPWLGELLELREDK